MAENLPEPKSRKESYLAKAAGMDVTVPEAPESREEQYLAAIAEGGGGGGGIYTAGEGIDITSNTISVDTDTIQEKLTAGDNISIVDNVISAIGGGSGSAIKELTADDYNYDDGGTGSFNTIALWKLDTGIYALPNTSQVAVKGCLTGSYSSNFNNSISGRYYSVLIKKGYFCWFLKHDASYDSNLRNYSPWYFCGLVTNTGEFVAYRDYQLVQYENVADNLTTTGKNWVLSAGQGKVLKDLIDGLVTSGAGAPTTATVGTVGMLYEDTTNGKLYVCTDATNPYVWSEVGAGGGGVTPVQTTGTSTTDVMSQDATTKLIYPDIVNSHKITIGASVSATSNQSNAVSINANVGSNCDSSVAIAGSSNSKATIGSFGNAYGAIALGHAIVFRGSYGVAIGDNASSNYSGSGDSGNVAIGSHATASDSGNSKNSVALGYYATTTRTGEVNVGGLYGNGYNGTDYRVIGGVHDGQTNHDCATVAQGNTLSTSAPTTSTEGVLGQLWTDTTNMHTYQCTAISGSTYTWTQRW